MTATACDYACVDNANADYCETCPTGVSECVGTTSVRVCQGTWMPSPCTYGCFESGTADYCGECGPGAKECVGNGNSNRNRTCGTDGKWGAPVSCDPQVCLSGTGNCVDCTPGATDCADAMNRRTCSQSGTWSDPDPCAEGTTCLDGVCGAGG